MNTDHGTEVHDVTVLEVKGDKEKKKNRIDFVSQCPH